MSAEVVEHTEHEKGVRRGPRPSAELADQAARLTRRQRRILAELHEHPSGLTVKELAQAANLHSNTIRGHIEVLERHGLVNVRTRPCAGVGRPSRVYVAQTSSPGLAASHLAMLLRAAVDSLDPAEAAETARDWGRRWAEGMLAAGVIPDGGTLVGTVTALMAEIGFAPVVDGETIRLFRCPLLSREGTIHPAMCQTHQGVADVLSDAATAAGLEATTVIIRPFARNDSCSVHFSPVEGTGGRPSARS
ncbi:MAG TPA: helix-turn-helix domain-containing protein [Actinomycetaceae bacterium]|nr:helix-turn-helix domain-containing protein [Actinomycetaceae bacterium]